MSYETARSYKKGKAINKVFSLLYLWLDPGSGIRDPGSGIRDPGSGIRDPGSGMEKNQDPGSGINIPDPQHCIISILTENPCNRALQLEHNCTAER